VDLPQTFQHPPYELKDILNTCLGGLPETLASATAKDGKEHQNER
jgi:hypothetical protein